MKKISVTFILCIILFSFNTLLVHSKSEVPSNKKNTENNEQGNLRNLQISLIADKDTYSIGEEIHFTIVFKNNTGYPLSVLIDDAFVGSNIKCSDIDGNGYNYEGGYKTWSPKAGVFTGGIHSIQPNSKMEINLDALLYDNYNLIFSNQFDCKGSNDFQDLKKGNNLPENFPDKYICAGRIFKLTDAGKFRFTYVYEATENDKNWSFAGEKMHQEEVSTDLLWIGKVESNTIELSIK